MFKKILIVAAVAAGTIVALPACGSGVESTCEHVNEKCANEPGVTKNDCSVAQAEYDKLSDEAKKTADKQQDCIDDAETCQAIIACGLTGG